MLNYTITSIPVYINRAPRHVVLYDEYNKLNTIYHTYLEEHALCLKIIKEEHNTLNKAVADLTNFIVPNDTITTDKLANNSITTAKIKNNAVTNDKLAGEIHSNKLKQPSKTDLYKYMAVTGYTKDLFYNFEPVESNDVEISHSTGYIDGPTEGFDHWGHYITGSFLIPLPDDLAACLVTKDSFNNPDTIINSSYFEKSEDSYSNDMSCSKLLEHVDLYIKLNYGDGWTLNTKANKDFYFYNVAGDKLSTIGVANGLKQGRQTSPYNTYHQYSITLIKQDNKIYLKLTLGFTLETYQISYYNGTNTSGYLIPNSAIDTAEIKMVLNNYPILPLY